MIRMQRLNFRRFTMKKNGFTLVELITTFSLISVVVLVLVQLILNVKKTYENLGVKTELLQMQGTLVDKLYTSLLTKNVQIISDCGENCLEFYYQNGENEKLTVDVQNKIISFGKYTASILDAVQLYPLETSISYAQKELVNKEDALIEIHIPIKEPIHNQDFSIHVVFQYNQNTVSIVK